MPILQNAKKALRVSKRKTIINRDIKSKMKSALDKVKKTPNKETLAAASSAIDRAVKKNLIHKNKAAHMKSRVAKLK